MDKKYIEGANRWIAEDQETVRENTVLEDTANEIIVKFLETRLNESNDVDALQTTVDVVVDECNLNSEQKSQAINALRETVENLRSIIARLR